MHHWKSDVLRLDSNENKKMVMVNLIRLIQPGQVKYQKMVAKILQVFTP